jgi:hypothetical protein
VGKLVLIRELALLWRSAGAASDERPLAIMKAANERANIARKKCLIDLPRLFDLA